jgi:hypothetical protein
MAKLVRRAVRPSGQVHAGLIVARAPEPVVGVERHHCDLAPPAPGHIPPKAITPGARGLINGGNDHAVEGLAVATVSEGPAESELEVEGRVPSPRVSAELGIRALARHHGRLPEALGLSGPTGTAAACAGAALGRAGDARRGTRGTRARATAIQIAFGSSYRHRHQSQGDGDQTQNDSPASHRGQG